MSRFQRLIRSARTKMLSLDIQDDVSRIDSSPGAEKGEEEEKKKKKWGFKETAKKPCKWNQIPSINRAPCGNSEDSMTV